MFCSLDGVSSSEFPGDATERISPTDTPVAGPGDHHSEMSSFSAEDDLDKVWTETIARVNRITNWDLNERKIVTIDEILAKVNPPSNKDGKYSEAQSKAKTIFHNALICVQIFGGFAANAAAIVFGPSQQAFNAISFVVTASQDYEAVFANITVLMERVTVFMASCASTWKMRMRPRSSTQGCA